MVFPVPLALRQRYAACNDTALTKVVEATLRAPSAQPDSELREWLISLSFHLLRPSPDRFGAKPTAYGRWLVFALHYLESLALGRATPIPYSTVLRAIAEGSDSMLARLLFAQADSYRNVLEAAYHPNVTDEDPALTDWQQVVIVAVRAEVANRDLSTIEKWGRSMEKALANAVIEQFRPVEMLVQREMVQVLTNRAERPSQHYLEGFERHLEQARASGQSAYYTLALYCCGEWQRRINMERLYLREAQRGSVATAVIAIAVAAIWRHEAVGLLGAGLLILIALTSFWGRFTQTIYDNFTWAKTTQETLDMLAGK